MGMGLELKDIQQMQRDIQMSHVRTCEALEQWEKVTQQPFNPRRQEVYQAYIDAVRDESMLADAYAHKLGVIPDEHLPFEYYYLYYKPGTFDRTRWEKICEHYRKTGEVDVTIGQYHVYE